MKASRIAAVGIVAAAGLWIASGHFLPHETAQSSAAIRSDGAAKKLFRVAVMRGARWSITPASSCSPAAPRPTGA